MTDKTTKQKIKYRIAKGHIDNLVDPSNVKFNGVAFGCIQWKHNLIDGCLLKGYLNEPISKFEQCCELKYEKAVGLTLNSFDYLEILNRMLSKFDVYLTDAEFSTSSPYSFTGDLYIPKQKETKKKQEKK